MRQVLPYADSPNFYKGNMHTHGTNSDGSHPTEYVCDAYREAGYDFLVMTDHFMERYSFPVTDSRPYRKDGFTTIIGAELHAPETEVGETWHIKAIGLPLDFAPLGSGETGPQIARRAYDAGAFIGIVHPSWYGLTERDADALPFAHSVEIYNHGSAVEVDRGNDWPYLDVLLNKGRRLTGYATDDAHQLTHDWLGGWVMVNADENQPDALLGALKRGHFYSSQGPEIHGIQYDDEWISVQCSGVVNVSVQGQGSRAQYEQGDDLTDVRIPVRRFANRWFRVTVTDAQGRRAWSNPVWLS